MQGRSSGGMILFTKSKVTNSHESGLSNSESDFFIKTYGKGSKLFAHTTKAEAKNNTSMDPSAPL